MPENKSTSETTKVNIDNYQKRKRVKRIKNGIIITLIILLLLPTILCIILGIRLARLQRQVDNIISLYTNDSEYKQNSDKGQYAYASESTNQGQSKNMSDFGSDIIDSGDVTDNSGETGSSDIIKDIDNNDNNDIEFNEDNFNNELNIYKPDHTYNLDNNTPPVEGLEEVEAKEAGDDPIEKEDKRRDPEGIYYGKHVYLTFDDGPSEVTDEILDILEQYNVKATFFVVGLTDDKSKERYSRIVNEGHTLGMHSYSHKYNEIYNSVEDFDKDFTKLSKLLYDTIGYKPNLYRFPGGSYNKVSKVKIEDLIHYLNEKEMIYYDWNVLNGDATGIDYTKEQMIDNVLNGVAVKKTSIVLMHDDKNKSKTADMLPELLDALISGGAKVLPMDDTVPLIQQVKVNSVK